MNIVYKYQNLITKKLKIFHQIILKHVKNWIKFQLNLNFFHQYFNKYFINST
jgi:hypothetical protein